jgi:hypothetical protein
MQYHRVTVLHVEVPVFAQLVSEAGKPTLPVVDEVLFVQLVHVVPVPFEDAEPLMPVQTDWAPPLRRVRSAWTAQLPTMGIDGEPRMLLVA